MTVWQGTVSEGLHPTNPIPAKLALRSSPHPPTQDISSLNNTSTMTLNTAARSAMLWTSKSVGLGGFVGGRRSMSSLPVLMPGMLLHLQKEANGASTSSLVKPFVEKGVEQSSNSSETELWFQGLQNYGLTEVKTHFGFSKQEIARQAISNLKTQGMIPDTVEFCPSKQVFAQTVRYR